MSLTREEASSITYRGWRSITAQLVLLGFLTGTGLLVGGYIEASTWASEVLALLSGYIIRDFANKAAEAYMAVKINQPPQPPSV